MWLGRMDRVKRWELAIEIADRVRRRGHDFGLTIIGHRYDAGYEKMLQSLAAERQWVRLLHDLDRTKMTREVASCSAPEAFRSYTGPAGRSRLLARPRA